MSLYLLSFSRSDCAFRSSVSNFCRDSLGLPSLAKFTILRGHQVFESHITIRQGIIALGGPSFLKVTFCKSQILGYHLPGKALTKVIGSSLKFCSCQMHGPSSVATLLAILCSNLGVRWGRNAAPPRGCQNTLEFVPRLFAATYHKVGFTG
jgi:hypothetical protein